MDSSLLPFFKPKGVVVVGASTSPEKLGYGAARNLIQSGYQGAIHFVGQKGGELFGRRIYTSLNEIVDPVDLAILLIPTNATPQTIEECGERGIKAAVIVSAGFRETGADGAALEEECLNAARKHGVRLLGPNCIGTIDTHLPLDTTFLQPPMPTKGGIGFISHSGAFCAAIIDWARKEGFGFSQIVSLGNQSDVNETEMLAMLVEDPNTKVIVLYMESVSDGKRFIHVAREVTQNKPVIALKVGRFEAGQKAAASHTGALAASDIAFDAAFEKAGILRAATAEQMFDWARALESRWSSSGAESAAYRDQRGVAILTNAGGPGVIAADSLEHHGLTLARLSDSTREVLSTHLPPSASIHNPVDMLASATPETYAACLKILLADPNVDSVMIILPPPPMFKAEEVAENIVEIYRAPAAIPGGEDAALSLAKPIVIALMGSNNIEQAARVFRKANIPTYPFPERAAAALSALAKRTELLNGGRWTIDHQTSSIVHRQAASIDELLTEYGIPFAPVKLARDEQEAVNMANDLGYPVVMKIASPDILHKSDVGGVVLDIKDASALQFAYTQMIKHIIELKPDAQINGVHIQKQILPGQEVIVGMVRDPQFGPLMMFGSGGVEVEGLKDVAFALALLSQTEALTMIRKTWAGRKLKGFRGIPPADEQAVVDVLIKLSRLALENESIEEIEINPLRVFETGAMAVDVRLKTVVK